MRTWENKKNQKKQQTAYTSFEKQGGKLVPQVNTIEIHVGYTQ